MESNLEDGKFYLETKDPKTESPSHWMPLPDPPQETEMEKALRDFKIKSGNCTEDAGVGFVAGWKAARGGK